MASAPLKLQVAVACGGGQILDRSVRIQDKQFAPVTERLLQHDPPIPLFHQTREVVTIGGIP